MSIFSKKPKILNNIVSDLETVDGKIGASAAQGIIAEINKLDKDGVKNNDHYKNGNAILLILSKGTNGLIEAYLNKMKGLQLDINLDSSNEDITDVLKKLKKSNKALYKRVKNFDKEDTEEKTPVNKALDYSSLKKDLDKLQVELSNKFPDDLLTAAETNIKSPLYATMTALKYGIQPSPPPTDLPSGWQYSWDKERGKYFFYHVGMEKGKGTYIKPTKPISEFKAASKLLASSASDPTDEEINDLDIKGYQPPPRPLRYQKVITNAAAAKDAAKAAAKPVATTAAAANSIPVAPVVANPATAKPVVANAADAKAAAIPVATAKPVVAIPVAPVANATPANAAVVNAKVKELDDAILKAESDSSNAGKAFTAAGLDVAKKTGEYSRLLTAHKNAVKAQKSTDEINTAKTEMDAAKALLETSKIELKTATAAKRKTDAALEKAKAAKEAYNNKGKDKPKNTTVKGKGKGQGKGNAAFKSSTKTKMGGTRKLHRKKLTRRRGLRKGPRKTRR